MNNQPTTTRSNAMAQHQPSAEPSDERKPSDGDTEPGAGSELVPELPKDEHEEELIDEGLTETFPASDPVAIPVPEKQRSK